MYQKFKKDTIVWVNGKGKEEPSKTYKYRYGRVTEKDSFFNDYKIQFRDGTTDWIDEKYLIYSKKYNERSKPK